MNNTVNVPPSAGRQFYEQIVGSPDPAAFLRSLVNASPPSYEEEWRDFKGAQAQGVSITDSEIKRIWSKSLSGFANTGGGVLVWGINARPDPATKIDAASGFNLVADPPAFRNKLLGFLQNATDPPVTGIEIKEYNDPGTPGQGFVVCFIPESTFKPHRALYCEGRPYYIRVVDRFEIAPHSLLRQLFFPQTHARLAIDVGVTWSANDKEAKLDVKALIQNIGTATARDLFVVIQTAPGLELRPSPGWGQGGGRVVGTALEYGKPLHPGSFAMMFMASLKTGVRQAISAKGTSYLPDLSGLNFIFQIYAAEEEPQQAILQFGEDEIRLQQNKRKEAEGGNWNLPPERWHMFT